MYPLVLTLHSWLRWLILGAGLLVILAGLFPALRGSPDGRGERRWSGIFVGSMDLQAVLGILLYFWLSPTVAAISQAATPWIKDSVMRFWRLEHPVTMILALVVAHAGSVIARKMQDPARARGWRVWSAALALVLIVAGIPWPSRPAGRPLIRTGAREQEASKQVYASSVQQH